MKNKVLGYTKEKVWQPKYDFAPSFFVAILSYELFLVELWRNLLGSLTLALICATMAGYGIFCLFNTDYVPVTKFKPKD